MNTIKVTDFTETPGFRYRRQGIFTGEEFREDYIEPYFQKNAEDTVSVDIDGVKGYPPSFFEEVFGGLSRIYGVQRTRKLKILCSNDYVKNRIIRYIDHGREK